MEHEDYDIDSRPQPPLVIRWELRSFRDALQRTLPELTLAEAGIAFAIVDNYLKGEPETSYSRDKNLYKRKGDRPSVHHTYRNVVPGVDRLDELGLIDHDRKRPTPRGTGRQSSMRPRPALIEAVRKAIEMVGRPVPAMPEYLLVRRSKKGDNLAVPDTTRTREMVAFLERMNAALIAADISCGTGVLRRIFHQHMTRGGRFYVVGCVWQNLPIEQRNLITINGEKTVELDYRSFHARLVYAVLGVERAGDLYDLEGWHRDLSKLGFLVLINADSEEQAVHALAKKSEFAQLAGPESDWALAAARALIEATKKRHDAVARAFGSDAGAKLMRVDSDMAERIMAEMLDRGEITLCLHDSFIVRESAEGMLREVMTKVAESVGLHDIGIDRKTPRKGPKPVLTTRDFGGLEPLDSKASEGTSEGIVLTYPTSAALLLPALPVQDETLVVNAASTPTAVVNPPPLQDDSLPIELPAAERSEVAPAKAEGRPSTLESSGVCQNESSTVKPLSTVVGACPLSVLTRDTSSDVLKGRTSVNRTKPLRSPTQVEKPVRIEICEPVAHPDIDAILRLFGGTVTTSGGAGPYRPLPKGAEMNDLGYFERRAVVAERKQLDWAARKYITVPQMLAEIERKGREEAEAALLSG